MRIKIFAAIGKIITGIFFFGFGYYFAKNNNWEGFMLLLIYAKLNQSK